TREAAHSVNRILHAGGDATGEHIELTLASLARLRNISILEHAQATHILMDRGAACGVEAMDTRMHSTLAYEGRHVILASGGAGRLFTLTTNPEVTTGDGIALAYRAGAALADMEFFQFHPTALRLPGAAVFLISEAVRGEGGVLRNNKGERFMLDYHPQGELAPRDVVARSIVDQMQRSGEDHVYLDITHLPSQLVSARFPQIYRFCLQHGVDITRDRIPVAPAAHYMMGGVKTNAWGETTLPNLYACGECACTGVHGANRLASNSLMEVLVFGHRVIRHTVASPRAASPVLGPLDRRYDFSPSPATTPEMPGLSLAGLQGLLWGEVGILRTGPGLQRAVGVLRQWDAAIGQPSDRSTRELANLLTVGRLMAEAALIREERRGAHYRTDFPEPNDDWRHHIVFAKG
ncbi:MAG: FAD-binding protein, partial [Chloroflexota bacterium]